MKRRDLLKRGAGARRVAGRPGRRPQPKRRPNDGATPQPTGRVAARRRQNAIADYIVVGSGAGGGTVAARLAEAGLPRAPARGRRRSADAAGRRPQTPAVTPARRLRRPRLPCARRPRTRRCGGTSSSGTTRTTTRQQRDPKYRDTFDEQTVDGVLYPRAGTLGGCTAHNAMILVYPHNADWNQIADLTGDRRGARSTCARTSSGSRTAAIGRSSASAASWAGTRAATAGPAGCTTEKAIPSAAFTDRRSAHGDPRVGAATRWQSKLGGPLGDRARLESQRRSERLARRHRERDRPALHAADDATTTARRHARAAAGRARAASGPAEDRARRARHARAVRRRQPRHRRRVPEGRAAVSARIRDAERGRRRRAPGVRARAKSSWPAARSTRRSC